MKKPLGRRILFYGAILAGLLCVAALIIPTVGRLSCGSPRLRDASNLKQLGQASLIYASLRHDFLPEATDVWDYARLLADSGILNDGTFWQSRIDSASTRTARDKIDVLLPASGKALRELNPAFRAIKPTFAVALGKLNWNMPSTTPIIWTRGLQLDGTWAKHSPYGDEGGYIVFIGGNVAFFKDLKAEGGQLTRFDGKGQTANILEALPPGCRIGEYVPTPTEQSAWSKR